MITTASFKNFTLFEELSLEASSGLNVLIGENGTGKTHILKSIYSACAAIDTRLDTTFDQKLKAVFMPNKMSGFIHKSAKKENATVKITRREAETEEMSITCAITPQGKASVKMQNWEADQRNPATYIPVKDMLANSVGFRSLYATRLISFEEIYVDILDKALLPPAKGAARPEKRKILNTLKEAMDGRVVERNEQFFLKNADGELEFPLLAEGFRKIGLLYALIQNDALSAGNVLLWDEPEANLNPKLANCVVEVLLQLKKMGVQIFLATHDYVLLKELELATQKHGSDEICYHLLHREEGKVKCFSTKDISELNPNAIDEAFESLLNRQINLAF